MTDAATFLQHFHPGGPWFVTAIKNREIYSESIATPEGVRAFVKRYNGADYYFTPGVLSSLPEGPKPGKQHLAGAYSAWVDLDPPKGVDLDQWRQQAYDLLKRGGANLINDSGRGFWGFWQLAEFGNPETIEDLNRRLKKLFGGDAAWNIDRIARLPGTINTKTGALAQVLHWQPGPATFPALPSSEAAAPVAQEWTTTHCEGSNPISDDNELIHKALASNSAMARIGATAPFRALWYASEDELTAVWPRSEIEPGKKQFNESDADASLAGKLAFWTGKDCARIERLMRMSHLKREKWDRQRDYLQRTILGAVAKCQRVYNANTSSVAVPTTDRSSDSFLSVEQQQEHFKDCAYIASVHRVLTPNGGLLRPEQFKSMLGGKTFELDIGGKNATTTNAFTAFTENRLTSFTKVDDLCFRPDLPPREIVEKSGRTKINTYVPEIIITREGDPTPFRNHLAKMIPDPRDLQIFESYLAALIQYPGVKFNWCPLLQGAEGNGKRIILDTAEYITGANYTHWPNAKELADSGLKFTGWLYRKLLIIIEEIHVRDRFDLIDGLKPIISDAKIEIQLKGQDQFTAENVANFILTSNFRDAIRKTKNDRRYAIFFTAHQSVEDIERDGMDQAYFTKLWDWMRGGGFEIVAHWLKTYPIPDEINPATHCRRAPQTTSTQAAIEESHGIVEQLIIDAVASGEVGFRGGFVSLYKMKELVEKHSRRTITPRQWPKLLDDIGYVHHPALVNGQVNVPIAQEGMTRPRLFIKKGSIQDLNMLDAQYVFRSYCEAQGYTGIKLVEPGQ